MTSFLQACAAGLQFEAVAHSRVLLLGDAIDPWDPVVVRASMGAIFHLRVVTCWIGEGRQ